MTGKNLKRQTLVSDSCYKTEMQDHNNHVGSLKNRGRGIFVSFHLGVNSPTLEVLSKAGLGKYYEDLSYIIGNNIGNYDVATLKHVFNEIHMSENDQEKLLKYVAMHRVSLGPGSPSLNFRGKDTLGRAVILERIKAVHLSYEQKLHKLSMKQRYECKQRMLQKSAVDHITVANQEKPSLNNLDCLLYKLTIYDVDIPQYHPPKVSLSSTRIRTFKDGICSPNNDANFVPVYQNLPIRIAEERVKIEKPLIFYPQNVTTEDIAAFQKRNQCTLHTYAKTVEACAPRFTHGREHNPPYSQSSNYSPINHCSSGTKETCVNETCNTQRSDKFLKPSKEESRSRRHEESLYRQDFNDTQLLSGDQGIFTTPVRSVYELKDKYPLSSGGVRWVRDYLEFNIF